MTDVPVADGETIPAGAGAPGPTAARHVVLLHGFMSAPWTMRPMGRFLSDAGFACHVPWYESWATGLDGIVARIADWLAPRIVDADGAVDFVGHSMGGLVARAVIERLRPLPVGRVVMIGTPNSGSEIADFCAQYAVLRPVLGRAAQALHTTDRHPLLCDLPEPDYPVGVIAGDRPMMNLLRILPEPHDGKVSVASTHLSGEADHIVLPVTHALMPYERAVQVQTLHFLRNGAFQR